MSVAVIDASAIVEAFTGAQPHIGLRQRIMLTNLTAPELLDVEVLNVLRKLAQTKKIGFELAEKAAQKLVTAAISRITHRPLLPRIWELRHSISAYDASYVALAEHINAPLVTCDGKLARSKGHNAKVELYPIS